MEGAELKQILKGTDRGEQALKSGKVDKEVTIEAGRESGVQEDLGMGQ